MRKLLALIPGLLVFSLVTTQVFGQAALLPNAKQTFLGTTGAPLASGSVTFYVPGTTNKKTTWQDSTQATNNQNPVPLDAAGRAVIYGQGNYRQVVKDANGNTIWDALTTAYGASAPSGGNDTAPVGSIMQWSGFSTPTNWAWANGQAISRTTYPDLLTAITIAGTTISCTASSATLGGWTDTSQIRVGAPIEASCIPTGTTVVSIVNGSTITVSNNATATITTTAKVFPWGNGDGVSTFNVPDLRGRVVAGADTMQAGSSAGRLTVNTTIATSSGSSTLTPTTLNGIYVGMSLVSANIPAGTTVSSIGTSTIVASNNATATATGTTAKFAAFVSADVPGATGGSQSHTQIGAEVGAHNHTITDPGHTHVPVDGNPDIIGAPNTGSQFATAGGTRGSLTTLLTATTNILINNSPTAVPAPIVQPTITSNYIIKVKGNITGAGGVISIGGLFGDIAVDATMQAYTSGTPSVNYIGIANATTGTMLANVSGSTVQPTPTTNSQWLDNTCGNTQGMISYRGASTWDCLTPGTSGFALVTNGAGANPSWTPVGANASTALKVPVDLATTGSNITLSGEQTIDGVLTSSSRVLVKDQSTASQNGIYTSGSGAWTRTADWNATGQVVQGTYIYVNNGTLNAGALFAISTANPIIVGTTAVAFTSAPYTFNQTSGITPVFLANIYPAGTPATDSTQLKFLNGILTSNYGLAAPVNNNIVVDGVRLLVNDVNAHTSGGRGVFGHAVDIQFTKDAGTADGSVYEAYLGRGIVRTTPTGNDFYIGSFNSNLTIQPGVVLSGVTGYVVNFEADMDVAPGANPAARIGYDLVLGGAAGDSQGSQIDAGIYFGTIAASLTSGWKDGWRLDGSNGQVISTTGSIIRTTGSRTITKGIDWSSWTFTGNQFTGNGWAVSSSGAGSFTSSGVPVSGQTDQNAATYIQVTNATSSANAAAGFKMIGGTANSNALIGVFDQAGAPAVYSDTGSAVTTVNERMNGTTILTKTKGGGVQIGAPTGGDKGAGTLNSTGLYINGTALSTSAANLTVGTSTISSGTSGRVLYDNAGILGEMTTSGTGTQLALTNSPSFVTPVLGVATGTSLALGGSLTSGQVASLTGNVGVSGYTYIGSLSAPTNTTAGDLTAGRLSVGNGSLAGVGALMRVEGSITGNVNSYGQYFAPTVQSDVTSSANGVLALMSTAAAAFTVTDIRYFYAAKGTFGAGSSVTNQTGFLAASNLTGATNNYGFRGQIAAASGRYNAYMDGTAMNVFAGNTRIGGTSDPTVALDVTGAIAATTTITATSGFVSGASAGLSKTYNVRAAGGAGDCTIIVTGGIATGGTC